MIPSMLNHHRKFFCALFLLLSPTLSSSATLPSSAATDLCVPTASWIDPSSKDATPVAIPALMTDLAQRKVVLLGESHDNFEHHRWQLQTMAALYARRPDMVLGFEMFPRRVQPALERWVAGELSEAEFLRDSDWSEVWNFDPALYMPIFHFARMNRIPMLALNIDRELSMTAVESGWSNIPPDKREGVTEPAPASPDYLAFLSDVFQAHGPPADEGEETQDFDYDNPNFRRFVSGQLVWDRAMADAIQTRAGKPDAPLVVAIMGMGHIMNRYGVPHQLLDLGIDDVAVLLPWDHERDCAELNPTLADSVFGVEEFSEPEVYKPRLGVMLDTSERGVRVDEVQPGSIAEIADIRKEDLIIEIAGQPAQESAQISDVVRAQAPGTWLPLKIKRGEKEIEIVAKFPVRK